ncbi:isopentenyl-diphosphate delta-isomerase [Candidatus Jorgensenbacteria bacterium RIFCSPLOWO2_01_FULL_45_25b]|uniref:Isopentenyl-diphosphate delta-isomerase n=1 Tax=Candidatus Jorgensenbacteria bacterium RIFCSPLOWO2_01_FULL_45_25b TaxID=1798471 RepID=A0A1F6BU86_9BACT|nr:MAG: isopentenyl-diphosphate delta-isomerase [Candidatus Jorgensenbacteria bacterium RIFCSPLOWO2_01_FULL_45_25b]
MTEHVVLVTEKDEVLGVLPKFEAHGIITPLHRAFSLFIFNSNGELLLQQRALSKKTWPGVWSNSCCGHPQLGESTIDAVRRRTKEELSVTLDKIECVAPYRYQYARDNVMENEICPIHVAYSDTQPTPNPTEVAAVRYVPWAEFLAEIKTNPGRYSEWCEEESLILEKILGSNF